LKGRAPSVLWPIHNEKMMQLKTSNRRGNWIKQPDSNLEKLSKLAAEVERQAHARTGLAVTRPAEK